jgi:hypothetical protein
MTDEDTVHDNVVWELAVVQNAAEDLLDVASDTLAEQSIRSNELAALAMDWQDFGLGGGANDDCLTPEISIFPDFQPESFELFRHYMSRTAITMSNGATPTNPFLAELLPLALSSKLVLQLLLCQSAAHKAITEPTTASDVATRQYVRSLKMFREALCGHRGADESNLLMLTMGALILCFTETARGDVDGAVFDHLTAVNPLALRVISSQLSPVPSSLRDFMVEYHVYTATLSMISMDVRFGETTFLNSALVARAKQLVSEGYTGHLCGCWLSLLLLIPRVYDVGRHVYGIIPHRADAFPSADDMVDFVMLQSEIATFHPPVYATPDIASAAMFYRQALYIYVWTLLAPLEATSQGSYRSLLQAASSEALQYLGNIPATSRVNTGLCWPLAVIGSVLNADDERSVVSRRLEDMASTISLGNIQATLDLLNYVWESDWECSPWMLGKAMQERGLWISFA